MFFDDILVSLLSRADTVCNFLLMILSAKYYDISMYIDNYVECSVTIL